MLCVILITCTNCTEFALLASGSSIAISQNTYAKVYNSMDECPNSKLLFHKSLSLPLFFEMENSQVRFVCEKLIYNLNKQIK